MTADVGRGHGWPAMAGRREASMEASHAVVAGASGMIVSETMVIPAAQGEMKLLKICCWRQERRSMMQVVG